MAAIFDSQFAVISRKRSTAINTYDDKIPSTIARAIIDLYSKYRVNPRRYEKELTEDLWIEIFIRLPAKSLLLVMCVCKNWYVLIKSASFTRKHLQFQKMLSNNNGHFLLLHDNLIDGVSNYLLFNGCGSSSSYRSIFHSSPGEISIHFKADGPINGLYCLHNQGGRIVIWNPATNEVGFLPSPHQCLPSDVSNYYVQINCLHSSIIGFGTDPLDVEDYKVILISGCCYGDDFYVDFERVYGMLYTTKTNTWRHINNGVCKVEQSLNNTYLNGSYYWIAERKCTVVVFDMSKEAFRSISIPCHGNIALHNDHIYLFDMNQSLNEIDIWVMMEENNWLKKICVTGIQVPMVTTLGFWNTENDLLLVIDDSKCHHNTQTVLYNTTTRELRNIGPRGYCDSFKASVYCESLISLRGEIVKYKGTDGASLFDTVCDFFLEALTDDEDD